MSCPDPNMHKDGEVCPYEVIEISMADGFCPNDNQPCYDMCCLCTTCSRRKKSY